MRTLEWIPEENVLELIDQRLLPEELVKMRLSTYAQVAHAIREMAVRGAPAIGVAAAFGMALAACRSEAERFEDFLDHMHHAAKVLARVRLRSTLPGRLSAFLRV